MKSVSTALSNHLDQEVTTLATCWKIVRRDGVTFTFTDHDQDLTIDGLVYEAESSYSRTAVASNADLSVDNLDVTGMIDSAKLDDDEMRNGLFNRADVYIFVVNWMDPSQGVLKVRRGWFGEVQVNTNGTFSVEIRGLAQALGHNFLEVYSPECRADFCDTRCKLNIADFSHVCTVTDAGNGRDTFSAAMIPDAPTVGTSVGAHKTWAFYPTNYIMGDYYAISEIRFWDQEDNLIEGGRVIDSLSKDQRKATIAKHDPKNARDGRMTTMWGIKAVTDTDDDDDVEVDVANQRLMIIFDTPVDVKTVEVIAPQNQLLAPTAWQLQCTDDDVEEDTTVFWELAKDCAYTWTAGGQSAVWGLGSDSDQPINIADDPVALPPPYHTVTSYVGGSINWLTGRNRGRAVEITAYSALTDTVEMFEPLFFPVQVGDTFEIAQGCDKSLARCKLYDNVINRRAEDFVPGNDELMSYPDAQD